MVRTNFRTSAQICGPPGRSFCDSFHQYRLKSTPLPTHNSSGLYDNERHFPLFPHLHQEHPKQSISIIESRPRPLPFEDGQLLSQSGILQCDLFVAGKDENDES
jgi:hypothetical protein